jgi:hypothetical protein
MPDSSAIDNALVAKLGADVTLMALMPNLVYMDEAPKNATRFVIVSLVDEVDEPRFGGCAYEDALYLVKAVELKPAVGTGNVQAAAARIQVLLNDQVLTVAGYSHMVMHRESRIRTTEVDDVDASIRWFHRGGHYRVQQAPV